MSFSSSIRSPRILFALSALALGPLACGGEPDVVWPSDPAGMRARLEERGGIEGAARSGPRGDGRHREILAPELADLDAERWPEEVIASELASGPFQLLREMIGGREVELSRVFTDDARLGHFARTDGASESLGPLVRRVECAAGEGDVVPAEWAGEVAAFAEGAGRVRYSRLTPEHVVRDAGALDVRMLVEVNTVLPDGGLRHDTHHWNTHWVRTDGAPQMDGTASVPWRCASLEVEDGGHALVSVGPLFVDTTLEALEGSDLDPRFPQYQPNVHLGVALAYIDDDDILDIAVAQPTRVLLGRGDGTFEDASERMGLEIEHAHIGVIAADFDNDGDTDLAWGARRNLFSTIYLQEDGKFTAHPIEESLTDNLSTSLSAHDVDGDGYLDLFIAGYGSFGSPGPDDPMGADNGRRNQMLKGGPGGTFTDVTAEWGFDAERLRWCFIGAFGDADGDGDVDLYAANDWGPNVLYRRVSDDPVFFEAEVEDPNTTEPGFSMSAFWADLDGDLDLDMYVSNMSSHEADRMALVTGAAADSERVKLMRRILSSGNTVLDNRGETFSGADDLRGARRAYWAWGTALFDYDLDADIDVHVVNGFLSKGVDDGRDWDSAWWRHGLRGLAEDPTWWPIFYDQFNQNARLGWSWAGFQRAVFFQNDGSASFADLAPVLGLDQISDGRAIAMGDLDRDGDVDLVGTSNSHPHLYVLRNDGALEGSYLWVEAIASENRSAAGTSIVVEAGGRKQRRDVALGSGYLSQHESAQHFGLAGATAVESVDIRWMDGTTQRVENVPINARIRVFQGQEGFERVQLNEHNYNATGRVAEIEWDADPARLRQTRGNPPDFGRFEFVDRQGERVRTTGMSRVLVLVDPAGGDLAELSAATDEIASWDPESVGVVMLPMGDGAEALPEGFEVGVSVVASTARQRQDILQMMRPWTGVRGPHYPLVVVLNPKGLVRALTEHTLRLDVLRTYLRR